MTALDPQGSAVRQCARHPSFDAPADGWTLRTLIEGFRRFGDRPAVIAVGAATATAISYGTLSAKVHALAAGLASAGIRPGDVVGLVAPNTAAWIIARFALAGAGAVVAALDHLSSEAELKTGLGASNTRWVLADAGPAATIREIDPTIEVIVIGDGPAPQGTRHWDELFVAAAELPAVELAGVPALLTYTSGTTGGPKGFFLGPAELWANLRPLTAAGLIASADRVLLPLPLHHIYPFLVGLLAPLSIGAAVVFPEAISGPEIVRAMAVAEVTAIVGVPRLYAALLAGIRARIEGRSRFMGIAFRLAQSMSIAARRRLGVNPGRWLFRRVRARIGPRLRLLVSGGAHLDPDTLWQLIGLGFDVRSGYGLAETASIFTGNLPGAERLESEGKPFQGGSVRIADPGAEGIGEIELRGPNMFAGYHNNPAANRDAFSADGWFRTGDLGRVDADGFLYVTGRLKEILVLGGGKKVNPEALEKIYGASAYIRELAVLEYRGSLVALVFPDFAALRTGPSARIDETIRINLSGAAQGLPSYERLAGFALVRTPLPRTRLGKYRRFLLPDIYRQAVEGVISAAPVAPLPEDKALLAQPRARRLYDLLVQRYRPTPVRLETNLHLDLGIDSLEWVSLSLAMDQAGLGLTERAFSSAETVRDLLRAAAAGGVSPDRASETDVTEKLKQRWLSPTGPLSNLLGLVLYLVNRVMIRALFRLRVQGMEALPAQSPYILVSNHASDLDAPVLMAALPYWRARRVYWGGDAVRLFGRRWLTPLWRALHVFPSDDRFPGRSLALAEAVLTQGRDLVWFPESWRTPDGRLQNFYPGIGRLLRQTGVAAVPVYIAGSFEALPRHRGVPKLHPIRVLVGQSFRVQDRFGTAAETLSDQEIAHHLFEAIEALERKAAASAGGPSTQQ